MERQAIRRFLGDLIMRYKVVLTQKAKCIDTIEFEFDNFEELGIFISMAKKHSNNLTFTITEIEEGEEDGR